MAEKKAPLVRAVPLHLFDLKADTQSRAGIDWGVVDDYVEALEGGAVFPEGDAFKTPDGRYLPVDCWHRLHAHIKAKKATLRVRVHEGTDREAKWWALGANPTHGRQRTNADKRHAIKTALTDKEWGKLSNREIADQVKVSPHTVARVREELFPTKKPEKDAAPDGGGAQMRAPRIKDGVSVGVQGVLPLEGEPARVINGFPVNGEISIHVPEDDETLGEAGPVVDIDQLAGVYRRNYRALQEVKREFDALAQREEIGGYLATKIVRLDTLLDDAMGLVRQAEPMTVCEKCEGTGCQYCYRTGFWTRTVVESLKVKS